MDRSGFRRQQSDWPGRGHPHDSAPVRAPSGVAEAGFARSTSERMELLDGIGSMPFKTPWATDVLSRRITAAFLREQLPADVAALSSDEPPEPVPVSFVDEELRQHHSDLLFRVRLNTGANALAYVLVEHKSSPEQSARLQLHGLVNIGVLSDISEDQKDSILKLFWSACCQHDCNWSEVIDIELAVLLGTCMCCSCRSREIDANNGYCVKCTLQARQAQIRMGKAHLLHRLLERRFGSLPPSVSQRLNIAPEEDLIHWSEKLVDGSLFIEKLLNGPRAQNN
jgi:hypothetical protein